MQLIGQRIGAYDTDSIYPLDDRASEVDLACSIDSLVDLFCEGIGAGNMGIGGVGAVGQEPLQRA